jgi:serine/threonine-protein kinase BUR1
MVTPYMDHDLSGLLDNPSVNFTVPQIKCYMLQLLEGVRYLHENHILHRDMKAANLLVNNKGILQIADFGLARHYVGDIPRPGRGGGEGVREYTSLVVTRWYRPPELLMHLKRYTTAIDMWGVGYAAPLTRYHFLVIALTESQVCLWRDAGWQADPRWRKRRPSA